MFHMQAMERESSRRLGAFSQTIPLRFDFHLVHFNPRSRGDLLMLKTFWPAGLDFSLLLTLLRSPRRVNG